VESQSWRPPWTDLDTLRIRGARTHNLKNIDVDIPRDKLIVITGVSGSGKSSLAFDTIYAEGQRRYVESLSSYARQFLSVMEKPDIDHIEGLSPAISIEQKSTSHNPRSTVGTVTEIYDYLRLLYARAGTPRCPEHGNSLAAQTVSQMIDACMALPEDGKFVLLAPLVKDRKGEHAQLIDQLRAQGFTRFRVDGTIYEIDAMPTLQLRIKHTIDVVVDRFRPLPENKQRLAEGFETALRLGSGIAIVESLLTETQETAKPLSAKKKAANKPKALHSLVFSAKLSCPTCDYSLPELEPRLFSFNAPLGACPQCDGLGVSEFFDPAMLIKNQGASLAAGAISGWGKSNPHNYALLVSLAAHYGFDLNTPWNKLAPRLQKIIFEGSASEVIRFKYLRGFTRRHAFEGITANMLRRYKESEGSREDLAQFMSVRPCQSCNGTRLGVAARNVFVAGLSLPDVTSMPVSQAHEYFKHLRLDGWRGEVAAKIVKEISERLRFLVDVGLSYLTLARRADTLSGGEAQRIRLASQIGAGLVGVMYVLDEPSIGLHQRDNARLLGTLTRLRDLGNTVIVVEHDEEAIRLADQVLDIGPFAGIHGGQVVGQGTAEELCLAPLSITGEYLSGKREIKVPASRRPPDWSKTLKIVGASGNNLKGIDLEIPAGLFTCVTGVSGSGKSTLVNDTLYAIAASQINDASVNPAPYVSVSGIDRFDKVVEIDQSPIGRTPRSNPATYTGLFTPLRDLFSQVPESRARGYSAGRFSFNVKGGRCEACEGGGLIKVEMHFLADIYVCCDVCAGKRYNRETLEILYKGHSISDVLNMTVAEAHAIFSAVPSISRKLATLDEVGLSYIKLGQAATTLSGGEAQRIKLSKELSRRDTGATLYILDEPTTGLHFYDVENLLAVLHKLCDDGNTMVVIEHNLDVIKTADWIVDLGPEGGGGGGEIIATGTPEEVAAISKSFTGQFLQKVLPLKACPKKSPPSKKTPSILPAAKRSPRKNK
jgi:excinuclease ABC subunit A